MNRRKPRIFKDTFRLKTVRTLIFVGLFSLVVLGVFGYMLLFWEPVVVEIGLIHTGSALFLNLAKVFLIITVILLGLILWISFLISRNLFGPLLRLRKHMEMLIDGEDPDKIRFRKTDELEFHYISEPFNKVIDREMGIKKEAQAVETEITTFLRRSKEGIMKKRAAIPFIEGLKVKMLTLINHI